MRLQDLKNNILNDPVADNDEDTEKNPEAQAELFSPPVSGWQKLVAGNAWGSWWRTESTADLERLLSR